MARLIELTSNLAPTPDAEHESGPSELGSWRVDARESWIGFAGQLLHGLTVRGSVGGFAGTAHAGVGGGWVASLNIDAATISTGDALLDQRLRSADVLDVGHYPTITFRATAVEDHAGGWLVAGDLTIRDITAPVTTVATVHGVATDPTSGRTRAGIHAWLVVDRTRFGLVRPAGLPRVTNPGSDNIALELSLRAIRHSR
jgi:polyisoprenoid-binding protein YceI